MAALTCSKMELKISLGSAFNILPSLGWFVVKLGYYMMIISRGTSHSLIRERTNCIDCDRTKDKL